MSRKQYPESAFHHLDHYIVFDAAGKPVEGHSCQGSADVALGILNDHNDRCGRSERYTSKYVEKLDSNGMPL